MNLKLPIIEENKVANNAIKDIKEFIERIMIMFVSTPHINIISLHKQNTFHFVNTIIIRLLIIQILFLNILNVLNVLMDILLMMENVLFHHHLKPIVCKSFKIFVIDVKKGSIW
jgi:hypothetical protein